MGAKFISVDYIINQYNDGRDIPGAAFIRLRRAKLVNVEDTLDKPLLG